MLCQCVPIFDSSSKEGIQSDVIFAMKPIVAYCWSLPLLDLAWTGWRWSDLIFTSPSLISKRVLRGAACRLFWRDGQVRIFSISETLLVCRWLLQTNLVARLWIFSRLLICLAVCVGVPNCSCIFNFGMHEHLVGLFFWWLGVDPMMFPNKAEHFNGTYWHSKKQKKIIQTEFILIIRLNSRSSAKVETQLQQQQKRQ